MSKDLCKINCDIVTLSPDSLGREGYCAYTMRACITLAAALALRIIFVEENVFLRVATI